MVGREGGAAMPVLSKSNASTFAAENFLKSLCVFTSRVPLRSAEFSVIFVKSGWSLAHQLADLRARKKGISQRMGTV
jgi:hypothetical protein